MVYENQEMRVTFRLELAAYGSGAAVKSPKTNRACISARSVTAVSGSSVISARHSPPSRSRSELSSSLTADLAARPTYEALMAAEPFSVPSCGNMISEASSGEMSG